jgi:hypothetical protein
MSFCFTGEATELKANGSDATVTEIRLKAATNEELKRLREMDWILDQLDQVES